MKKKVQKVLMRFFDLSLFCGYFYILFVSLACGLGADGGISQGQAIKIVSVSLFLAAAFPGLIWYQHRRIMKLEKLLDDLYEIWSRK
ncbi:MAG: hypothetical protein ACI4EI_13495 [Muricoprocola sp.]